jgi:hypothetical protein
MFLMQHCMGLAVWLTVCVVPRNDYSGSGFKPQSWHTPGVGILQKFP